MKWYRKAAAQGDPAIQYALGRAFLMGDRVPKDVKEGMEWLRKSAAQGEEAAKEELKKLDHQ